MKKANTNRQRTTQTPATPKKILKVFRPPIEETDIHLVSEAILGSAESFLSGCERCRPHAEMSFDYIIDELTGCDPTRTEYLLPRPAKCPLCCGAVTEKTLVTVAG